MSKKEIALTAFGVLFILTGVSINEWVLGYFTSDGRIDASGQLLIIRLFNISFIIIGFAIILLRKSDIVIKLLALAAIMIIMFIVIDTMLYLGSPWLPESLVLAMSPKAQV